MQSCFDVSIFRYFSATLSHLNLRVFPFKTNLFIPSWLLSHFCALYTHCFPKAMSIHLFSYLSFYLQIIPFCSLPVTASRLHEISIIFDCNCTPHDCGLLDALHHPHILLYHTLKNVTKMLQKCDFVTL